MDLKDEEVLITLTPLEAPNEFPRTLTLNETIKRVEVGRTSRSANKDLKAAHDNAWFDSPIISRNHATFSATADKRTYLRDNNSTHGTYIGGSGDRLEPRQDHPIKHNEIITFGVSVTNGPNTYSAKKFCVSLEWRPSRSSRAGSVEILDSLVRTFSVPSTEDSFSASDDDIEISHIMDVRPSEPTKKQNLVVQLQSSIGSVESGASPMLPIELRDEEVFQEHISSSDSEDEPEVLSSKQTQIRSDTHLFGPFSTRDVDSHYAFEDITDVAQSRKFHRLQEAKREAVAYSKSNNDEYPEKSQAGSQLTDVEHHIEDSILKNSNTKLTVDFDGVEGESFDIGVHNSTYFGLNFATPASRVFAPAKYRTRVGLPVESAMKSVIESSQIDSTNKTDHSRLATHNEETDKNNEKESTNNASVIRRSPSPSDAALVKKATVVDNKSACHVGENCQKHVCAGKSSEYQTPYRNTPTEEDAHFGYADYPKTRQRDFADSFDSSSWSFHPWRPTDRCQINDSVAEPTTSSSMDFTSGQNSRMKNCTSSAINRVTNISICGVDRHEPKENGSHSRLKRKADQISVDEVKPETNYDSRLFSSESSQDDLTDAQPRGTAIVEETVGLEDFSTILQETTVTVHSSATVLSEPPRKKVKKSNPTAIGIGKFVSGLCCGVVGVCAAFIATIPLSVREEAMQELFSSA